MYIHVCKSPFSWFYIYIGPNSSDTSDETCSHDDSQQSVGGGEGDTTCDQNGIAEESLSHSGTPNPLSAASSCSLEYSSPLEDFRALDNSDDGAIVEDIASGGKKARANDSFLKSTSEENLHRDSNGADWRLSFPSDPGSYLGLKIPWVMRRRDSDFSTAPFSSETSDMDTSGNEKPITDGCSNGEHSSSALTQKDSKDQEASLPPLLPHTQNVSDRDSSTPKKKEAVMPPQRNSIGKKPGASTTAPPGAKRPLKASFSTPNVDSRSKTASKLPVPKPKPARPSKPEVKPKPGLSSSTGNLYATSRLPFHQEQHLQSSSSGTIFNSNADSIDFVSERSKAIVDSLSQSEHKLLASSSSTSNARSPRNLREAQSESPIPPSSPFLPRKLSYVQEESEDKEDDSGNTSQSVPKSTPPFIKSQLLTSKPKPPLTAPKRFSPAPGQKPVATASKALHKLSNDDTSSASETTSSQSSASPIVRRKPVLPQKPTVPPKKPSLLRPTSVISQGSSIAPLQKLSPNKEEPPVKPPTARRRTLGYDSRLPVAVTFNNKSTAPTVLSPPPPQLPPRSLIEGTAEESNKAHTLSQPSQALEGWILTPTQSQFSMCTLSIVTLGLSI